jgi:hypothetical protein
VDQDLESNLDCSTLDFLAAASEVLTVVRGPTSLVANQIRQIPLSLSRMIGSMLM